MNLQLVKRVNCYLIKGYIGPKLKRKSRSKLVNKSLNQNAQLLDIQIPSSLLQFDDYNLWLKKIDNDSLAKVVKGQATVVSA